MKCLFIERNPILCIGKVSLFILCLMFTQIDLNANTTSKGSTESITSPTFNTYSIGDFVWKDVNKNGKQDYLERGVRDVFVGLLQAGDDRRFGTEDDELVAYTVTDYNGKYSFDNLPEGEYMVQIYTFSIPDNYVLCPKDLGGDEEKDSNFDPDTGLSDIITLGAGARSSASGSVDAGLFAPCGGGFTSVSAGYSQTVGRGASANTLTGLTIPFDQVEEYEYQWMVKKPGGNWEPIPGATEYTYDPGAIYNDCYFVLCWRVKGCPGEFKESNVIVIEVGQCNVAIETDFAGNGCIDEVHTFTAGGMGATTQYTWSAEGGTIDGEGKSVTITWAEAGNYYVELTAEDAYGCTHTTRKLYRVVECNDYPCCIDGQILTVLCLADNGFGVSCTVYVPCEYTENYLASGDYFCGECDNGNYCYAGTGTVANSDETGFDLLREDIDVDAIEQEAGFSAPSDSDTPIAMSMNIYPNPAGSQTTVSFTSDTKDVNENVTIQLINRQAGLIMQKEIPSYYGFNELPLDLSNVASGIYFVRIIKGDDVQVQRFVKMDRP